MLFETVIDDYASFLNDERRIPHSILRENGSALKDYIQGTSEFLDETIDYSKRIIEYILENDFELTDKNQSEILQKIIIKENNPKNPDLGSRIGVLERVYRTDELFRTNNRPIFT